MNQLQIAAPCGVAKRPAAKRRKQKHPAIRAVVVLAIALTAGVVFRKQESAVTSPPIEAATAAPDGSPIGQQEELIPELLSSVAIEQEPETTPLLLGDAVPLDSDIQTAIWEVCREDPRIFCTVMAIANVETHFDTQAIGDSGNSIGLLQIQPRWHQERMDSLGVTNLLDPAQNTTVAVDYMDEIAERLNPEHPEDAYGTHDLLMVYNQGWSGASRCWAQGIYSTEYSATVMDSFTGYLAELGAAK